MTHTNKALAMMTTRSPDAISVMKRLSEELNRYGVKWPPWKNKTPGQSDCLGVCCMSVITRSVHISRSNRAVRQTGIKKRACLATGPFLLFGGEGGIRTLELTH